MCSRPPKVACLALSAIVDVNATSLTTIFTTENKYISKLQVSFLMFGLWNRWVMDRSTLYMVDSSSLFVVSISGKLYHLMLNNESQLVCDVENVLSLWAVFNKHTIGSQLQSSLQSLDVHDGCIQRGSLCINALPHSLQEIVDSDHSRETINDQRHTTTTWIDSKTAETSYTGLHWLWRISKQMRPSP